MAEIKGVEVFAAGTWNGDTYTTDDLDEMVRAFSEMRTKVKPSLKLGHADKQALLQKDGYPAAGWVTALYRMGEKLIADFSDIPEKVAELIKRKAYRKVSSEIYWNINIEGRIYKRLLSAVALLGQEMPAVTCLDDMLALYGIDPGVAKADRVGAFAKDDSQHTLHSITLDHSEKDQEAEMPKTDAELKLESDLKAATDARAAAEKAKADSDAELADLRKFKADTAAKLVEAEKAAAEARVDAAITKLQASGLVSPAMKPFVRELLGAEKKEYSVEGKSLDRIALVEEILKLHSSAESVNFSERTRVDHERKDSSDKESALDAKITKYAADHKVTYGVAYREVMKAEKAGKEN